MSRLTPFFIIALIATLALGGCGPSAQRPVALGEKDAGRTVELRVGQALEITLPGNPTTGYLWEVASVDAAVLKAVGEPQFKADSSAVGSGGQITLRFEAIAAGQTALQLIYHRPFEKDVPPEKTFEVTVVVK